MAEIHTGLSGLSVVQNQLVEKLLKRKLSENTLDGLVRVAAGSRVPLSPTQARIWFFSQLYPESAEYNIFETLSLGTAPQEEQLESALRSLVERHDALRLQIVEVNGEP